MDKRQVFFYKSKPYRSSRPVWFVIFFAIFAWLLACKPITPIPPASPTPILARVAFTTAPTPAPTSVTAASSPTPEKCSETRGQVQSHAYNSVLLPNYHIYLPPCYDFDEEAHYPVLYLLHGANFEDDQWVRLGIEEESPEYIIVMPYEKYSLRPTYETEFGEIFINDFLPYIDRNYRTQRDKKYRAIGGLSRGGGWAIRYGLTRWDIFGAFGAHSPAIFYQDYARLNDWLCEIPADSLPRIYIDTGDKDQNFLIIADFGNLLAENKIAHTWRLYLGFHNERYWRAHVAEYLRWYGEGWTDENEK